MRRFGPRTPGSGAGKLARQPPISCLTSEAEPLKPWAAISSASCRPLWQPCIGYFRHPFEKLTAWSFTILLFFFVM